MARITLLLGIVIGWLGAGDFNACIARNALSIVHHNGLIAAAIDKERLLVPLGFLPLSVLPKEWKVERYDPISSFAIVRFSHDLLPIVFRKADRMGEHKELALFNKNATLAVLSEQITRQRGMKPALLPIASTSGTLLSAPCYAVVGISVMGAVMESDFLTHFIESNQSSFSWGDLGVRMDNTTVSYTDPFVKDNPFVAGDRLIELNAVAYASARELERAIALLTPSETAAIVVEREGKRIELNATVATRQSGFLASDTFLERFGWSFDSELFVQSVRMVTPQSPLMQEGDQLVAINGIPVANEQEVMAMIATITQPPRLLVQRDRFQFFINLEMRQW
ncbi:MAG: hypothetical protein LBN32_04025 [Helicobacteraceae bacterium]|nr:hypothetical protein [Helicobacteraceae bacterium]